MENNGYNERRYNRKKQWYRIRLGMQQLINYPVLNLIWLLFGVGMGFLVLGKQKLTSNVDVIPMLASILNGCMQFLLISFSILCAIGIIQMIGQITAMKDEGDMRLIFGDRQGVKNQPPILVYKRTMKKKGVTVREIYSTIPMEQWQDKKEAMCDIMDIHLIGDIEYGGKNNNIGNRIVIKSAKGRKIAERGRLYDDTF